MHDIEYLRHCECCRCAWLSPRTEALIFPKLLHGECVAIGCVAEAYWEGVAKFMWLRLAQYMKHVWNKM